VTGTQLVSGDIERYVPSLLAESSVVALVPATELKGWAAEMAWRVARAAAAGGRRTALVDCFVDAPTLHAVAGAGNEEGLVDAFEYGASLNRIVQAQQQSNLFFIPAGTFNPQPQEVMQNPRWRRLSAGFRYEEALLLLYVSADHLDGLAAGTEG
jgi:Mrp family chromosome partitioning ATPase